MKRLLRYALLLLVVPSGPALAAGLDGRSLAPFVGGGMAARSDSEGELWERIRRGFRIPVGERPEIDAALNWIKGQPGFLTALQQRSRPYLFHIASEAERYGLPLELALLPAIESGFRPFAQSEDGAAGLWQFVALTGQDLGLEVEWWYDERRDIIDSTRAALRYLKYLARRFDGDWALALAAYNAGMGRVGSAISLNLAAGKPADFWSLDLPRETRDYVPRFFALCRLIANPAAEGVQLAPLPNRPHFVSFLLKRKLDLGSVAKMAGVPERELIALNPGFERWLSIFEGEQRLLVPIRAAERFQMRLAQWELADALVWGGEGGDGKGSSLLEIVLSLRKAALKSDVPMGIAGGQRNAPERASREEIRRKLAFHGGAGDERRESDEVREGDGPAGALLERVAARE